MTLSTGTKLSHYEITSQIGKGGMGEVYQAKDQKLGRDVAIKVLPEEFALDTDRVARFQREAKLLASLNHPNIAAIYGLEEADDTHFLVMELIEGDTLRDRIKSGPIPVEEALKLALQMAEALEAAHEKGVIHRDLKPANIKVTPDGKVKILDFGLAKAYVGDQENMSPMDSPTISAAATQQGVILGTAAYMSPEQARGKPVDKRADIWAFGVVLYEMLTGKVAFSGDDVTDTLAAVIRSEPEWKSLPANLHWRLKEVLERCLEKKSKDRYSGISDVRVDIQKALTDPSGLFVQPITGFEPQKRTRTTLTWVAAIILTAIIAGIVVWNLKTIEPPRVTLFDYRLPEDQTFTGGFAVSADGAKIAYAANNQLYLKSFNELDAKPIPGTDEAPMDIVFSPDGQWIIYFASADQQLKKISISGGASIPVCEALYVTGVGKWQADNTVVYGQYPEGVMQVSANGGTPELLAKPKGYLLMLPQILPNRKSVLATHLDLPSIEGAQIIVRSLESGEQKELFPGHNAQYLSTGHLIYLLANNLFAVPFDLDKLEVTGGQVSMIEGVREMVVSDSGTLVYRPGTDPATTTSRTLVWVDRKGDQESLKAPPNHFRVPKISPDGTKVASAVVVGGNTDIYIWDNVIENMTRLTFDKATENSPLWTPDGKRIVFASDREGNSIYWKNADGTGEVELLYSSPDAFALLPWSWSGDGKALVIMEFPNATTSDIGILSMENDHTYKRILQEEFAEGHPKISPDGRYIAYMSSESGAQAEIYVRPFPDVNKGKWQVSTTPGVSPLWSPDGRELYYLTANGDAVMSVPVNTESTFSYEKPKELFRGDFVFGYEEMPPYDVHPDGKRFLMMIPDRSTDRESTQETATPHRIIIVQNWFEELKQRVPVD